jgi:hypothetical protein
MSLQSNSALLTDTYTSPLRAQGGAAPRTLVAMHTRPKRRPSELAIALLLATTPAIVHAHGQQAVFMPLGQLVALIPAAVIAWRLTSGILVRTVVILAALLVPVFVWFLPNYYLPWWLLASETSSFLTGLIASTLVATAVALSWRSLRGKDRFADIK